MNVPTVPVYREGKLIGYTFECSEAWAICAAANKANRRAEYGMGLSLRPAELLRPVDSEAARAGSLNSH